VTINSAIFKKTLSWLSIEESAMNTRFPTTCWSRIAAAKDGTAPGAHEDLAGLCAAYWYRLYAFIRRQGRGPEEALDLTQDYFARLLERHTVKGADARKGKFRSFLLADCTRFLADQNERAAAKRGGGTSPLSIDMRDAKGQYLLEPSHDPTPERLLERAWALADADDLRRFQNEVKAIALLDHPGIVPVSEVGEHEGQRYFSTKLVEGGSLAEQLAAFKENPKAAATLVAEATEAVHHAHMRGILHRDLKPANIVVDLDGHPQVTDFELAKQVKADFELTHTGAILGTPAFMSPEQAAGHRGTITTATDVHGLGAILYPMLTGEVPFGGDSDMDTLDAVRSQPPDLPRKLNSRIPRDLETIALRCLEKDPRSRYASAQALADDLYSWLDSRPIAARRVGSVERAYLWGKRRPALAAATLLAIVGATVAVLVVQGKVNTALRTANMRRQERFEVALEAIQLPRKQFEDLVLKANQFKPLRDRLLSDTADYYDKLHRLLQERSDPASRGALGNAYFELGELTSKIGDKTKALAAHCRALEVRRNQVANASDAIEARDNIGKSMRAVAELLSLTGHLAESLMLYEEARDLLEGLPPRGPGCDEHRTLLGRIYNGIGFVLENPGKKASALRAYGRSVEIRTRLADERPAVAKFQNRSALSHLGRGNLQAQIGKLAEARDSYRSALEILHKLVDGNPLNLEFQNYLASGHLAMGQFPLLSGKPVEARESYRRTLAVFQKLATDSPAVTDFQNRLAKSNKEIGKLQSHAGRGTTVVAPRAFDMTETGRREPLRCRVPETPGGEPFRDRSLAFGLG
jgi:tetratricopeptide (TPR) repeat protein/DNA-directed RNA polymerase specialized sigma24 family protein